MNSFLLPLQTERLCPSSCPVCSEAALKAHVTLQKLHFECGSCGSFDITIAAKSVMNGRSRQEREKWLAHARGQNASNGELVLIDRTNEP
jgi:hypothetical protein